MSANVNNVPLAELRAPKGDDEAARLQFAFKLKALTWDEMLSANGVRRLILINEMIQHGVDIEVRVNLAKLRQRDPDAEELTVAGPNPLSVGGGNYPPLSYTFTERWQKISPVVAFWLHQQQWSAPGLGAEYLDDGYVKQRDQEGEVILKWRPISVPRVDGILEFRAPADARQEGGSTTTGGLFLPRVELPAAPTNTGLPPGLSLDDIPEVEGDVTADDALDALAPATPRRSPARRPA